MENAISVPIDTNSLSTCIGNKPAKMAVIIEANIVALCGTPCFEWTFENIFGSSPSLDME